MDSLPADRERARALVLTHGWNATAYQLLNPGISLWFSRDEDAVIGYVKHSLTRVVGGAPVCALDRLKDVAQEFLDDATTHRERVCYFGAGERLDEIYAHDPGWSRAPLGAQPVWNPGHWSERVAMRSSLRAQFNRARNKEVRVTEWPVERATDNPALRRALGEWLADRHLPPLHFMVEPETLRCLDDRRVFVAERGDREVVGFTVFSPVPKRNGWLVEQIIRGRGAPNGTAELLLDTAVRAVASDGATYVTLGLSPLSERAGQPVAMPVWLRLVLKWVRVHGRRFYNFGGLDTFKAKFNPEMWEPIYAIADSPSFPPRALYAIAGAFSGGAPIALVMKALLRAARQEVSTARRSMKRAGAEPAIERRRPQS
ncbi:MAG TPA: DUF2156 domain-containing protein [Gemmatimonadaceae bacterium]